MTVSREPGAAPSSPPRRGSGRAGREPPHGSGKPPLPPRSPAQGGLDLCTTAAATATATAAAAMQETNTFLLSALQPEAGVCSLALPSDRQLDGRSREAAEAQRLRSARVQEQVRIRMMLRGQAAARPDGTDHVDGSRGGRAPRTPWAIGSQQVVGAAWPVSGFDSCLGLGLGSCPSPD